jgi:anti-sigma factor RsiW
MAGCKEIGPMLGAFEDGELEPHEMHEVARHLAQCKSCEGELADYAVLGRRLRSVAIEPNLAGFAASVQKRLTELTPPIYVRVLRYFESARDRMVAGMALGAAALATAALTAVMLMPYASQYASRDQRVASAPPPSVQIVTAEADTDLPAVAPDSRAVISSLESHVASVGVWSEPEGRTAVIWVPDQH